MSISTASVPTASASRYLQQLCKHWSHRFAVTFDPAEGRIDFGEGKTVSLSADADRLVAAIASPSAGDFDQLERVVEDHIRRFAFREELSFAWVRTA